MTSPKPAASTFFSVSAICRDEPISTEFSVRSSGRIFCSRYHVDEIAIARRHVCGIARERRDDAFLVVADLPGALRRFLRRVVGEMGEIAAHQRAGLGAVARASLMVEI